MAVTLRKRPLTVEQFERMIGAGIIAEDDRVELFEGDIVEMAPIGVPHASYVIRVTDLLRALPFEHVLITAQSPIQLNPLTRVEPDVAVVRRRADFYATRLPGPDDIFLVVEVADTSLAYDRHAKIPAYSRAGVPEAWLVDITTDHVEVYRGPSPDGYREIRRVGPDGELSVSTLPDVSLPASRVVGPPA